MFERLLNTGKKYAFALDNYLKMQGSQQHLLKNDLDIAETKFREAINNIIDERIREHLNISTPVSDEQPVKIEPTFGDVEETAAADAAAYNTDDADNDNPASLFE